MSGRRCVALVLSCAVLMVGVWSAASAAKGKPPVVHKGPRYGQLKAPAHAVHRATKATLPFTDGFEATWPGEWSDTDYWGRTSSQAKTGTYSAYCVQDVAPDTGPYPNDSNEWLILGPFSTADLVSGQAVFQLQSQIEDYWDYTFAGFSTDGLNFWGTYFDADTAGWEQKTVSMTDPNIGDYTGKSQVWFALVFQSDSSVTDVGSYVDDVTISGAQGGVVRGRLMGPAGRPLHGACLTFTQNLVYAATEMYTKGDGNYSKILPVGTYVVAPHMPGYTFTPASKSVTITPGGNVIASFLARYRTGDGVVNRYALVVGISEYDDPGANLSYCDDDAADVHNWLTACGWSSANIRVLLNSQATKAAIMAGITWLVTSADADDIVLFYQSSHGTTEWDLPPYDELYDGIDESLCTYELTSNRFIRDDELSLWFRALRTRKYVVLLDTCFSGGQIRGVGVQGGSHQFFDFAPEGQEEVQARDLDDLNGGVVVTACRDYEYSYEFDALQNGLFTYYLVEGLSNSYADLNQNGFVSAEELYTYVRPRVDPYQTVDMWDGYPNELEFADLVPLMSATVPARGATGVNQTADLTITWTWTVNQASAESLFKLKDPAGNAVPGAFTWPTPNMVMCFNPTSALRADSLYTVEVAPGLVLNTGGVKWYGDKFTFRTGGTAAIARPLVVTAVAQSVSGGAEIRLNLSTAANVEAVITNIAGRVIRVLAPVDAEAGVSTLLWNGKSNSGLSTPAGQYLVRVRARDASGNSASFITPLRK
ncbi:caspase family protein [bacterium]|nr:caspase family protein [bacterium]